MTVEFVDTEIVGLPSFAQNARIRLPPKVPHDFRNVSSQSCYLRPTYLVQCYAL